MKTGRHCFPNRNTQSHLSWRLRLAQLMHRNTSSGQMVVSRRTAIVQTVTPEVLLRYQVVLDENVSDGHFHKVGVIKCSTTEDPCSLKCIPGDYLMKLVERMPSVCKAVIKSNQRVATLKHLKYKIYFDLFNTFCWLLHDSVLCYFIVLMSSLSFYTVENNTNKNPGMSRCSKPSVWFCI